MKAVLADRRGSVLVEFALVALVLTLLLSATVDLGRLVFAAEVVQDAARAGARELSVTPLPAAITFNDARDCRNPPYDAPPSSCLDGSGATPIFRDRVFDPDRLVLDITADVANHTFDLDATCAALPIVNRVLCPLMIVDRTSVPGTTFLRYPGTLLRNTTSGRYTVMIAAITERDANGAETGVTWLPVVEGVGASDDPTVDAFSLAGAAAGQPGAKGVAAIRVNYPFQAAMLSGFRPSADGPLAPNIANVNVADDSAVAVPPDPNVEFAAGDTADAGPYAGRLGLGQQFAFAGKVVRPFRRVVSAQAVFRREVFQETREVTP
jgi:Flp pilus assembly protein TadG